MVVGSEVFVLSDMAFSLRAIERDTIAGYFFIVETFCRDAIKQSWCRVAIRNNDIANSFSDGNSCAAILDQLLLLHQILPLPFAAIGQPLKLYYRIYGRISGG